MDMHYAFIVHSTSVQKVYCMNFTFAFQRNSSLSPERTKYEWSGNRSPDVASESGKRRKIDDKVCYYYSATTVLHSLNNPGELEPEETCTHSHLSLVINHPLSASSIYYDPWHPPCSIYMPDSLFPLSPSFLWSTSWPGTLHFILHTFLHPIIVFFSQHMLIPSQPVLL